MINAMVNTEGNAYEALVIESSGTPELERAALNAFLESEFEPAMLNGQVVHGSIHRKFVFTLEGGVGVRRDFGRKYDEINEALNEGRLDEAGILMEEIEELAKNLYENAILNFLRFSLYNKEGRYFEQMESLKRALAYSPKSGNNISFLSEDMVPSALSQLFILQVYNKYFAEAVGTFNLIKQGGFTEAMEPLQDYYDQIVALRFDDSSYEVGGQIDDLLPWHLELYKGRFSFSNVVGRLDEIKLRCTGIYRIFPFQEDLQYTIPESWGSCLLEVLGDPEATFSLRQYSRNTDL